MCLIISKNFASEKEAKEFSKKPTIAKKNITVYKILDRIDGKYASPYRGSTYKEGELKRIKKFSFYISCSLFSSPFSSPFAFIIQVHRGLHAFTSKERARRVALSSSSIFFKMVIPKGSLYFKGNDEDIVSNQLYFLPA